MEFVDTAIHVMILAILMSGLVMFWVTLISFLTRSATLPERPRYQRRMVQPPVWKVTTTYAPRNENEKT